MAIGKVIKGDQAPESERASPSTSRPRGVLDAEDFEARQTAQAHILAAQRKAQELIADAEARKAEFIAKGREQGRQEVLAQAQEVIAKAALQRDQMFVDARVEILQLALRVAERIIGRDLERQPETIVEICATAIEATRQNKAMVLRLNPVDAKVLRERQKDLFERVGQVVAIAFKEDPEVGRGGVIIQTDGGTTDAQLSTQIEMLRQVLLTADEPVMDEEVSEEPL